MRVLRFMPRSQPLVTAEEFERIPNDDYHYELVRGRVIRVSPPGSRRGMLITRMSSLLARHVEARSLGVVISTGGFKLESNPDTVREPDVAFVRRERISARGVPDGYWPGPPDLAVEIRSPGDRPSEIREKVAEYLGLGVRLVWVVDSRAQTVTVHRADAVPQVLGPDDVLDAGEIVPGFSCPVRRIFE